MKKGICLKNPAHSVPTYFFTFPKLDLLSGLVADYSDEHYSIGEPTLIDMLKLRMYEMGLNQLALSKLLGISPSRICEYLNGKKRGV